MNFLWESWFGLYTDPTEEAIVNVVQGKDVDDYRTLLQQAFAEIHRVLKDDAWLVVVFHNSSCRVWDAFQAALKAAGFAVHGTQTFDKRHGTFKQFVSDNAVGYDLVLHCRKATTVKPLHRSGGPDVRARARRFIEQALQRGDRDYVVHYRHVCRSDEFDFRRLYADWLADTLVDETISLNFEEFRALVNQVLEAHGGSLPASVAEQFQMDESRP
jgi:hypothetical protein